VLSLSLLAPFDTQTQCNEGVGLGRLLEHLGCRLATSMTGLDLDTNQQWLLLIVLVAQRILQLRYEFVRMQRHNSICVEEQSKVVSSRRRRRRRRRILDACCIPS
jgi:hypothetical protein